MPAREDTINVQLGEVLQDLRRTSWRVLAEHQRTLRGTNARPDVLIEEPSGWPVVIEAERENHASAESDALARLGAVVDETGRPIESAIALVYPADVRKQTGGKATRAALNATDGLEYALYTATSGDAVERLPESGWLRGGVRDLAMLAQRAAIPAPRVERLVDTLEHGVNSAEGAFNRKHREHTGDHLGPEIAAILGQSDDQGGQTRRMAMTVLINALIFHESLAQAEFKVDDGSRRVAPVRDFISDASGFDQQRIIDEWRAILKVNYWPIFATAAEILDRMPIVTADAVLYPLWEAAQRLIRGGVTKSHDLTGVIFQRLIADRKFLATFYTRPASAALLAGLAIPAEQAPGGAEWDDGETIASLQVGDFACGTGTLLSAAYQRISLLHELHGGDPKALHRPMMKNGLVGLDVLNISVHLTAAILAGSHPDVPFDGECLLTMPYGRWGEGKRDVAIGSLDLLAEHVQPGLIEHASAVTAGGRKPEDVRDLINRVSHGKFDLVIMNPPFSRPTNNEKMTAQVLIPPAGAFETSPTDQRKMSDKLGDLASGSPANGNAGWASHFGELAERKRTRNGTVALVLPLSAASGVSWDDTRQLWRDKYARGYVISIARPKKEDASFSADTDIAEVLTVLHRDDDSSSENVHDARWNFVILRNRPNSAVEAEQLAERIQAMDDAGSIRRFEDGGGSPLKLGDVQYGTITNARVPASGPWPLVGVADLDVAQVADRLAGGRLQPLGVPAASGRDLPIVRMSEIATRGPIGRDITGRNSDGTARGPFDLVEDLPSGRVPEYPLLWAHDAKRERHLVVQPDSEGIIRLERDAEGKDLSEKAAEVWDFASHLHFSVDFQYNSQPLAVAFTDNLVLGGRAWPSICLGSLEEECLFALWWNSTLGLLTHWWLSNKTQSGRGSTTPERILELPTLDTRVVQLRQKNFAEEAFAS